MTMLHANIAFGTLGLFVMGVGAHGILTGRVRGKGWSGLEILTGRLIYRDERPILFWITVLAYLVCPPMLMLGAVFGRGGW